MMSRKQEIRKKKKDSTNGSGLTDLKYSVKYEKCERRLYTWKKIVEGQRQYRKNLQYENPQRVFGIDDQRIRRYEAISFKYKVIIRSILTLGGLKKPPPPQPF